MRTDEMTLKTSKDTNSKDFLSVSSSISAENFMNRPTTLRKIF